MAGPLVPIGQGQYTYLAYIPGYDNWVESRPMRYESARRDRAVYLIDQAYRAMGRCEEPLYAGGAWTDYV